MDLFDCYITYNWTKHEGYCGAVFAAGLDIRKGYWTGDEQEGYCGAVKKTSKMHNNKYIYMDLK